MTILYVDDDPDDRQLFLEAVTSIDEKIVCITANDGLDGLSWLGSHDLPDLIFLDINMPLMNGKTCLTEIKNNRETSSIPVIIFTTSNNPREKNECTRIGAEGYVLKPVSYLHMRNILLEILNSRAHKSIV
jgi:CheY-like chemotaxis protein